MTTSLFRPYVLRVAFSIPLFLSSTSVLGDVSFPSNPQTMAECDEPVAQIRAMLEGERALRRQKYREVEAMPYETGGEKYRTLMALLAEQLKEADRIRDQRYALEKTCRAAAQANQKLAAALLRELGDAYNKAKRAYEQAKAIYEQIRNAPSEAYARRNDVNSPSLESAMSNAKQYMLDLVPKSEIVGAIQDASFFQLKSQIQQLNGDMAALESAIQSVHAQAPSTSGDTATEALPRRGSGSSSALFQQAINKSEQEERDRPAREARERAENPMTVAAGARETPEERLTKSYDQRIAAAQEQCAATESSCQKGCLGVVAMGGLLSLFSRSSAGLSATSEQSQLCSNRCTEARSSCDEQVSSLEQEKTRAISDARTPQQTRVASFTGGASVAGREGGGCEPDPGLFQNYVEASNNWMLAIGRSPAPVSALRKYFEDIRAQHLSWSPAMLRQQVEVQSRPSTYIGPQSTKNAVQSKIFVQMIKCEIGQRQAAAASTGRNAGSGQANVGGGQGSGISGECKTAYDRQEAEFAPIGQRIASTSSPVRQMQMLLGMLTKRMTLLDQVCKGQPQYAEYAGTQQQYEGTMRNCRGIASNPGDCVPK